MSRTFRSPSRSTSPDAPFAEWLRPRALAALVREHRVRAADHGHLLWGLVTLSGWWQRLAAERKASAPPVTPD